MHKIGSIPFKVYKNKVAVLFVTSQVREDGYYQKVNLMIMKVMKMLVIEKLIMKQVQKG